MQQQPASSDKGFQFIEQPGGKLHLAESGRPVYTFNSGPQLPEGVPEDRRRAVYLHPVWTPKGVVVTDDFPKDHYHHRGVFWAWQQVGWQGKRYDLWTLKGVGHRFTRFLVKDAGLDIARLVAESVWVIEGQPVVYERLSIDTGSSREQANRHFLSIQLTALSDPVVIAGCPDEGKGYGGVSCRYAPRTGTVIRTDSGLLKGDEDHGKHVWAELEAQFKGGKGGLQIHSHPANPTHPEEWCLRQYGFVGASFPALKEYVLEPGRPVKIHYGLRVFDSI